MRTRSGPRHPRLLAVSVALVALLGSLLAGGAFRSADAGTVTLRIISNTVAAGNPTSAGNYVTHIRVYCSSSSTCRGKLRLHGTPIANATSYAVGARSYATLRVYFWNTLVPEDFTANPGGKYFDSGAIRSKVEIYASSPSDYDYHDWVSVEPLVTSQKVVAAVNSDWTGVSNVSLTLVDVSGLVTSDQETINVANGGSGPYTFKSKAIGSNNAASSRRYKIRVSGTADGVRRTWWWRGSTNGNNTSYGGSKTVEEGTSIQLTKYGPFEAKIRWGAFTGTVNDTDGDEAGAEVHVLGLPIHPQTGAAARSLDYAYCANSFGADTVTGTTWRVAFVPRNDGADKRYLVQVTPKPGSGSWETWNKDFGSCQDALAYTNSTSNLLDLGTDAATGTTTLRPSTATVQFRGRYSGYSEAYGDRYVSLRRYIPGKTILDMPIVKVGVATPLSSVSASVDLTGIPPGKYWAELGRRTSCAAWYPSVYANNDAYLQGEDRGNERWKSFEGKYPDELSSALEAQVYAHNYVPKAVPSGKRGWMYRDVCVSNSAGQRRFLDVPNDTATVALPDDDAGNGYVYVREGATISGHVTRAGGKSNKEMMVSAYSTVGTLVMRSAYTNSSGNFKIRGLASGKYRIGVNLDSWRGIGRSFSGTSIKSVTAGHDYSVGTLYFSG